MAAQDRKETEHRLNQARRVAAALVTVTERLAELIDELEGKLRTEKEEKAGEHDHASVPVATHGGGQRASPT